jgi:hypothetical protein
MTRLKRFEKVVSLLRSIDRPFGNVAQNHRKEIVKLLRLLLDVKETILKVKKDGESLRRQGCVIDELLA